MTSITIKASDGLLDKDFQERMQYRWMRKAIDRFNDKVTALRELERFQQTGVMGATPPIMGLIISIGYFENRAMLEEAIFYLKTHYLGGGR